MNIFMLKIVGLWPEGDETYKFDFYTLYAAISLIFFVFGYNFCQTFNILFIYNDLQALTGTIFIILTHMLAIVKSYYLIQNMKTLKELLVTLNSDIFQPKTMKQRVLIEPNLNIWKNIYLVYFIMVSSDIAFWSTFPILDKSVKEYRLPFLAWFPYNTKISPLYEMTYIYQIISVCFIATVNLNIDTLIAALNMYIGAQCDILCDDLRNLRNFGGEVPNDVNGGFIKCTKHHKEILRFATNSNIFFNWIVLAQFVTSVTSIGLTMFQMTVVKPFTNEFYSFLFYGMGITVETFMYCWFGNEVEIKVNITEV
ncbi:7tm 6 domain containing protein [Asbolus verrucosus]|uniref:7tm 6 domain containing protein n=1 Tax=Asbolus verrucosus TaxID=1661398 RepID=A0A482WBD4_ASBVE|nr:7tm 6 domain containing protein [Asbolus verrucosus]